MLLIHGGYLVTLIFRGLINLLTKVCLGVELTVSLLLFEFDDLCKEKVSNLWSS